MAADQLVRGIGHHGLWGFSPAFDFLEALTNACDNDDDHKINSTTEQQQQQSPINILLVHPGDIRHILYTISRRKRHSRRPIHFYLLDPSLEILARDLLLLEVAIDFEIPIRQRANIFLEIFGNSLVQERTARYIEQLGQKLISLAVNSTTTLELVDLHNLKYKERDGLEEIFKSYNRKFPCDMRNLRDHRMRGYYAERYDARRALCDWDWQYTYRETAASIVHITLYRDWRERGIAFEFGDQSYVEANRTMLTFVEGTMKRGKDAGHNKEIKGFWSDIVTSPYFSFGLEADSRSPPLSSKAAEYTAGLFEILNKDTGTEQHRHHTVEIAVFNLFSILWEIEIAQPYSLTRKNDIFSGLGEKDGDKKPQQDSQLKKQDQVKEQQQGKEEEEEEEEEEFVRVEEILDPIVEEEASAGEGEEKGGEGRGEGEEKKPSSDAVEIAPVDERKRAEEEAELLSQELKRAECIIETFRDVKIFPLVGSPAEVLKKSHFTSLFDGMFVSSRAAQFLQTPLANSILRASPQKSLIAVETAKYLPPLLRDKKSEFIVKEKEFAEGQGWTLLTSGESLPPLLSLSFPSVNGPCDRSSSTTKTRRRGCDDRYFIF